MRKFTQQPLPLLLLLFLSMQACKNYEDFPEIDEVDAKAEIAVPVFHGVINVGDLIEDTAEDLEEISIQPDGSLLLSYEADGMQESAADLVEPLPDFPIATNRPTLTVPFNFTSEYQVSSMHLKAGTLSFVVNNSQTLEDINVTITFPNLIRNGEVFSVSTFLDYDGSFPVQSTIPDVDLAGYDLTVENGSLTIEYVATDMQGDPVDITIVTGEAKNWTPDQITGVWARQVVEVDRDTIEIDLFDDNYIEGDISFTDPRFTLMVDNSFGVPTRVMLRQMNVITVDNQVLSLEGSVMNNGFDINYPTMAEMGTSKQTIFTFNKDNSNIADILNSKPTKVIFVVDAIINPDNETTEGYLHENSEISLGIEAELPVEGMASGFVVEESFDVDVEADDAEDIEFVELKLISRNAIPLNVESQFYFQNQNNQIVDSLFVDGARTIIAAAQANASNNAQDAPEQIIRVMLTRDQIDLLVNQSEMISRSSFSTTNNGSTSVSLNVNQEIDMKMGVRVKLQ